MYGHLPTIKFLSELGCDPLQRKNNGDTAVHVAALNGHLTVLKYFREKFNCDINDKNKLGTKPHTLCM